MRNSSHPRAGDSQRVTMNDSHESLGVIGGQRERYSRTSNHDPIPNGVFTDVNNETLFFSYPIPTIQCSSNSRADLIIRRTVISFCSICQQNIRFPDRHFNSVHPDTDIMTSDVCDLTADLPILNTASSFLDDTVTDGVNSVPSSSPRLTERVKGSKDAGQGSKEHMSRLSQNQMMMNQVSHCLDAGSAASAAAAVSPLTKAKRRHHRRVTRHESRYHSGRKFFLIFFPSKEGVSFLCLSHSPAVMIICLFCC